MLIIPCFFHFIQCWWRKANSLGLRKKNFVNKTKLIIFNSKLLPFLEFDTAIEFYKKIKEEYMSNEYESFFEYFENTWMKMI